MRLRFALAALFGAVAAALAWGAPAHAADEDGRVLVMLRMPAPHYQPNAGYQGAYGGEEGRGARVRIANRLAKTYGLSVVTEWPMPRLGVHCFVMQTSAGNADDLAAKLSKDSNVSWSEPLHIYHAQSTGPDPLLQTQPAASAWHLSDLHRTATGRNVQVAVIDSAIDAAHPDLIGQVVLSRNFMQNTPRAGGEAHGTGVAGVIAAHEGNGVGIAGIAPDARLLGLRACAQDDATNATACDSLSVARALDFALGRGAQIVNLSFSGPPDMLLSRLLDLALARGMFVVAAYDRGQDKGGFPASYPGVIAVNDAPAPKGAFQALGRDIPTTEPGGRWGVVNGSSFAAAHVSGLLALVRERNPGARGASALVIGGTAGTIDACATLLKTPAPQCGTPKDVLAGR